MPMTGTPLSNLPEYSVSELSHQVKRTMEETFGLVRVKGELSGFKRHTSGHLYFTMKDADACLDAVCWRNTAGKLGFRPEDGLEIICVGRLTTYPGRSKYQLIVEQMEPAGVGALMALLEERKKKLAAEGLFEASRKKAIPFLPEVIGVITSPTGAVIRDILHRLRERFPRNVLLWPVPVQGEDAAERIAAAIRGFNTLPTGGTIQRPDLLIVARGGGSIEDLWAFNEEVVVRAAAESQIPLISAVGHETDTTLIDFAADRRAPTPTAAAEMAVPVRTELIANLLALDKRTVEAESRFIQIHRDRVSALARAIPDPRRLLETVSQRLDDLSEHLRRSLEIGLGRRREAYARLAERVQLTPIRQLLIREQRDVARAQDRLQGAIVRILDQMGDRLAQKAKLMMAFSYHGVLERGFALVRDGNGRPVHNSQAAKVAKAIEIEFHDGRVSAAVGSKPLSKGPLTPSQGSLL